MGIDWFPLYGKALGTAVEDAQKALDILKTNKFTKKDLDNASVKFETLLEEIDNYFDDDKD